MSRRIIVCLSLLGLLVAFGCAPAAPAPTPLAPVEFTGSKAFTSEPFEVTTNEWQLNWQFAPPEKGRGDYGVFVFPAGEEKAWIEGVTMVATAPMSGKTYLYQGKGKYYIKVTIFGACESWKVTAVREPAALMSLPVTLSGVTNMTTPPFKVTAKEVRINWTLEPAVHLGGQKSGVGTITVYRRGELEKPIMSVIVGAGSQSFSFTGPGEFYTKVDAVGKWSLEIVQ